MNIQFTVFPTISVLLASILSGAGQPLHATEPDTAEQDASTGAETETGDKWGKFLPLPIFITEPAIGEGLGAVLIYFHKDEDQARPKATTARELGKTNKKPEPPPTATGIFGAYTNNDTATIGIGHSNSFMDDTYRVQGAAADARINTQYYITDTPFDFRLQANLLYANPKRRMGDSNAFLGVTTSFLDASVSFDSDLDESGGISLVDFDLVDVGLAASLVYDTRDNTLMPESGYIVDLTTWQYNEALGGDFNYRNLGLKGRTYYRFTEDYVLGLRLDATRVEGKVPFYAEPYVKLRGIPALRYQGKSAGAVEVEVRRRIGDRWAVSLFTGAGSVSAGLQESETRDKINTFGFGLRFLALKEEDAWVGIDVAEGPEDVAWYIQMGNAW